MASGKWQPATVDPELWTRRLVRRGRIVARPGADSTPMPGLATLPPSGDSEACILLFTLTPILGRLARSCRRGSWKPLTVAVLAVALAACAALPLPDLPDQVPARWRQGDAPTAVELRSWWKAFGDPTLDALVERALAHNLSVAETVARVEASRRLAAASGLTHLPQVGFHTYSEPTPDSSASYFQFGFDAKWELGWFGRSESEARIARGSHEAALAQAQAARVSVVAEVVKTYLELRAAQQREVVLAPLAQSAQRRSELMATRVRLRLAAAGELARAQAQQAAAQAAVLEQRSALVRAGRQLTALLGEVEPEAWLAATQDLPQLGEAGISSAPADLVRTRPEIRRAEAEVIRMAGELGLARADRFPRLGLGGALTYASKVIGHTRLSDAAGIVTFGPAIEIPLFDWGQRENITEARHAELAASLLAYRRAVVEGVAEAETALATLEQQRQRELALRQAVAPLEREAKAAATRERLGLGDAFGRLDAESAFAQARLDLLAAQQDRGIAFVALYKALGGAPLPHGDAP